MSDAPIRLAPLPAVGAVDLGALLELQREAFGRDRFPDAAERQRRLDVLAAAVAAHGDAIADAVDADFSGKSRHESQVTETHLTVDLIRYLRANVAQWMRPRRRRVGLALLPGRAAVVPQPLGVVGVISPWNYPVHLALAPLATALAAGNRVLLKPSELAPNTSALMARILDESFAPDLVATVHGGPEVGAAFAALPFDHLVFTGSTHVGRLVLRAAAENLTPVTLELGGKSPALVHPSYPLRHAAERIVRSKLFNAGQTCIATDYALVPATRADAFVDEVLRAAASTYPTLLHNPDYTAVINERHRDRLERLVDDAVSRGARAVPINPASEDFTASTKLVPRVLRDVRDDMRVMQDEIFGPLLPVVTYRDLEEALAIVNERPRPLVMYYFDRDPQRREHVLRTTHSGGVTFNDTLLHFAAHDLVFGGVGSSGMGAYHGREGFDNLSHLRGVFTQPRFNLARLVDAPYGRTLERLLNVLG